MKNQHRPALDGVILFVISVLTSCVLVRVEPLTQDVYPSKKSP